MPRNQNEFSILDNMVRRIVREELGNIFSNMRDSQENAVGEDIEERPIRTIGRRTKGINKGKVKNPLDRRLKQNRGK